MDGPFVGPVPLDRPKDGTTDLPGQSSPHMVSNHVSVMIPRPSLRLWPGVTALVIQWLLWTVPPLFVDDAFIVAVGGGMVLGLVILIWWLFFSHAAWLERITAVVVMVTSVFLMFRFVHPSVSNGMMGAMLPVFSVPLLCLALVGWPAISHSLPGVLRLPAMVVAIVSASAAMTLVRTDGISSSGSQLHWRWTPDAEERLLARGIAGDALRHLRGALPADERGVAGAAVRAAHRRVGEARARQRGVRPRLLVALGATVGDAHVVERLRGA